MILVALTLILGVIQLFLLKNDKAVKIISNILGVILVFEGILTGLVIWLEVSQS